MHGTSDIKFANSQQTKATYNYQKTKEKTLWDQRSCIV